MGQTAALVEAPAPVEFPLLLNVGAAARLLGCSRSTFFRLKATGKLPLPVRPLAGGDLKYRRADLEKFVLSLPPVKRSRRAIGSAAD
jgi:predicted DNA-binding transcriptional regulator AlpA